VNAEALIASLWPQVQGSIALNVSALRAWQRGELDDTGARDVAHKLAGSLGSYRRHDGGRAARALELRIADRAGHRDRAQEDRLIAAIERAVAR
jgi:HPt (histidine-containing phosphotransfer) domain-containing protein